MVNDTSGIRIVSVTPSENEEVRLPRDVAAALGASATLTVGPDDVVTLRSKDRESDDPRQTIEWQIQNSGARPIEDPSELRTATRPLSEQERRGLVDFLADE